MSVAVTSFAIFAASQIGTPGPANMALLATGARYGLRRALPFVAGVALGKQLVIWPVGFGLMQLAETAPWVFVTLKYISAAYIIWLAWRVAQMRLKADEEANAPGFMAGLIVHPLNPKAWAMITAGFTAFTAPGTSSPSPRPAPLALRPPPRLRRSYWSCRRSCTRSGPMAANRSRAPSRAPRRSGI